MKNRKIKILKSKRFALALALAAVASLGTGCGQQAYDETDGGTSSTSSGGSTPIPTYTGTSIPSPTPTTTTTNGSPNYSFHFQVQGTGYASQIGGGGMQVSTDTVLSISVTAGNGLQLPGTGYTVGFNCEMFNIKVGNDSQTAFVKKSNYTDFMLLYGYMSYDPCESANTTWTADFSSSLSPGHGAVNIQVNGTQYDNCRLNGDVYDGGCGMSSVYSTHLVDGFLQVTTD